MIIETRQVDAYGDSESTCADCELTAEWSDGSRGSVLLAGEVAAQRHYAEHVARETIVEMVREDAL